MQRVRIYTTYDIGRMTGTDPTTVHKWIDKGLLRGFRTPGGHRRVTADALKAFLVAHGMPVPEDIRDPSSIRLLIVDDDLALLRNLAKAVKKAREGWEVEASSDGYQALLMIPTFKPNALVLDILMPGLDGLSVLKSLKSHEQSIHVIAASAKSELEKKALAAGASAYLKKPLGHAAVIEAVERACGILAPNEQVRI
jgi:excisionase family DNA binding protein